MTQPIEFDAKFHRSCVHAQLIADNSVITQKKGRPLQFATRTEGLHADALESRASNCASNSRDFPRIPPNSAGASNQRNSPTSETYRAMCSIVNAPSNSFSMPASTDPLWNGHIGQRSKKNSELSFGLAIDRAECWRSCADPNLY